MRACRLIVIGLLASLTFACNFPLGLILAGATPTVPPPASTAILTIPATAAIETPNTAPTATTKPASATPASTPTPAASIATVTPLKDPVNCRFGPSLDYAEIFALKVGDLAPITGKSSDGYWWQVTATDGSNQSCWVADSVVAKSGNLSGIPIVPAPLSLITGVQFVIKPPSASLAPGCLGPFPKFTVTGTISVNGPSTILWQIETQQDGTKSPHTLVIPKYGSQNITFVYVPSAWENGFFWVHLNITSPVSITREVTYRVKCQ